jgi:hypothetical protein
MTTTLLSLPAVRQTVASLRVLLVLTVLGLAYPWSSPASPS